MATKQIKRIEELLEKCIKDEKRIASWLAIFDGNEKQKKTEKGARKLLYPVTEKVKEKLLECFGEEGDRLTNAEYFEMYNGRIGLLAFIKTKEWGKAVIVFPKGGYIEALTKE